MTITLNDHMANHLSNIEQISLSHSVKENRIILASAVSHDHREHEVELIRKHVMQEFGDRRPAWNIHERLAPFNVCLSRSFAAYVRDVHLLLDRALVDIVERWFSDVRADFPTRMPLERHEEDLLRWIDGPGSKLVPPFRQKYGMWRTDYLVEGDRYGENTIKVCEVNARIPFNGIWLIGSHGEAYKKLICKGNTGAFEIADDFEDTKKAIYNNFDPNTPLFHIHDKWKGADSVGFLHGYEKYTNQPTKHAKLTELRLHPDIQAVGGYRLLYDPRDGSESEEIQQCTLELFQEELEEMNPILLCKLATCCVNDFRTILLLHDKRILGIVLDELDKLTARDVFTKEEAERLRNGVAETLLPGTPKLKVLWDHSKTDAKQKDGWIVKPVRDAGCRGIRLGEDMTQEEWLDLLQQQCTV